MTVVGWGRGSCGAVPHPSARVLLWAAVGSVVFGAFLVGVTWSAGSIASASPDPNATYSIVNVAAGKCVQIGASSTADSAKAQIQPCHAAADQYFKLSASGAYYAIRKVNSNKCLDVQAKSTANGAAVIQYTCSGATNQQWSVTDLGGGASRLTARHSAKVMDAFGSTANGTGIVQYTWANRSSQKFQLTVSTPSTTSTTSTTTSTTSTTTSTTTTTTSGLPADAATQIAWQPPGRTLATVETSESQGLAFNGRLWVFGGFVKPNLAATLTAASYDPATNLWTTLAPMPEKITHAGTAVVGQNIYLAGGFVGDNPNNGSTDHVWRYDTVANTWTAAPSLPALRGAGALVALDGKLHFFGGAWKMGATFVAEYGDHWVLDPSDPAGTWKPLAPMPNPRNHLGGVAVGGRIYALGGQHLGDEFTSDVSEVDAYDPVTDSWTQVASLAEPRGHLGPCSFERNGRIIVVSGVTMGSTSTTKTLLADIDEYDPTTNRWTSLTPLPDSREAPVAGAVGNTLVVVNGGGGQHRGPVTWLAALG
jgi:N-acetylneuraminic acid mutarotase